MSGMYNLPNGWVWVPINAITEINPGLDTSALSESTAVSFIPMAALEAETGSLDVSDVRPLSNVRRGYTAFKDNDILFAKITPCMENGKCAVARSLSSGVGFGSTEFHVLRPEIGIDPLLLRHYVSRISFRQEARRAMTGSAGQLRVPSAFIAEALYPLAPLAEQKRIVEAIEQYLTELDAAVTSLRQNKEKLKLARAATLKYAVEGKLTEQWRAEHPATESASELLERILQERRAKWEADELAKMAARGVVPKDDRWKEKYKEPVGPDATDLPELPDGWCWATVEQLASPEPRSIQSGPFGSALLHSEFQDEGILAIGIDNVLDGYFSMGRQHRINREKYEELRKFTARPLDVLITVMATVGRCCVVPADLETAIITKHVYRITVNQTAISPYFLVLCLSSGGEVHQQLFGQVQGMTRPGINGEILRRIAVPLPPLAEQQQIVAEVERRLSIIAQTEAVLDINLKLAESARQSILEKAFAGKLVLQDPNDEPASVLLERIREERQKREQEELQRRKDGRMNSNGNNTKRGRATKREKRTLYEVLSDMQQPLTPEVLFQEAGLQADNVEHVNSFFEELSEEVSAQRIKELRPDNAQVLLEATPNEA